MSAEMPPIEIRPDHWKIVQRILQEHVPDLEVWAFGSRAKGSAKAFSDLDLAIITDEPLPIDTSAALNEAFSESDLPWKVDVVDWTSVGDGLKKAIKRDKVLVKERSESTRSEWKQVSLHEVCHRVTSGGTPSRRNPAYYEAGVWPWVKTQELKDGWIDDTEEHITDAAIAESSAKVLPANTVLLAMYGATVGQLGILRRPMACNQACCAIISDDKKSDFRFLYYYLLNIRSDLRNLATGAAQQNLSGALIKSLKLTLPDLSEQRAIARILGALDDKIDLNRKQNETLEAMARALFKAWFVDFEPVHAKMEGRWKRGQSLPGMPAHLYDLFPDRMVESELGEIPEGWEVGSFTDIVDIVGGGTPKTSVSEYWGGGIPWFSVADTPVSSDVFVTNTERSITQLGLIDSSARLVEQGATIISARGTVGNLAIAGVDMTFNQSCYALQARQGCWKYFVFLSARRLVDQLKAMSHGSVFSTITRQTFMAVRLVLPPIKLVCEFERCSGTIFGNILTNVETSRVLGGQREALIPYIVSGRLRVSAELIG